MKRREMENLRERQEECRGFFVVVFVHFVLFFK
jgi:hypothetical protein